MLHVATMHFYALAQVGERDLRGTIRPQGVAPAGRHQLEHDRDVRVLLWGLSRPHGKGQDLRPRPLPWVFYEERVCSFVDLDLGRYGRC